MNARTALERLVEAANHPYKGWYIYETGDGLVAVKHGVRMRAKTVELLHDMIDKRDKTFEAVVPAYMTVSFLGKRTRLAAGDNSGHTGVWNWIQQAFNVDDQATFIRQHANDKVQIYASPTDHNEFPLSELIQWVRVERGTHESLCGHKPNNVLSRSQHKHQLLIRWIHTKDATEKAALHDEIERIKAAERGERENDVVPSSEWRNESLCEAYTDINFRTKADLRRALEAGRKITIYQPNSDITGHGCPENGHVTLEGPHAPEMHRWYATAVVKDGYVVPGSVK